MELANHCEGCGTEIPHFDDDGDPLGLCEQCAIEDAWENTPELVTCQGCAQRSDKCICDLDNYM